MLAWFELPGPETVDVFKALVAKHEAVFEGHGTDARDGHIEGYVIFGSKGKLETFTKHAAKLHFEIIGSTH